ncbi:MAG: hypothetical protein BGO59_31050 [Spirosoma sp. 48-14]|nr:MAG: hypothetical protein BGO59_31050 [Spirosoma sp. 48-14]
MAFHSGIGSTMGDVDRHFEPIVSLIGANEIESAITEINNLRYLLFGLMNKQTAPNALAFCCCIHSVNNVRWDDFVEEGLEKLLGQLSEYGLTQEHIVSYHQLYEKKS